MVRTTLVDIPAIYITLFNGRLVAPESGEPTPAPDVTFGPFAYVHAHSDGKLWLGGEERLFSIEESIYYDCALYRDWLVFCDHPDRGSHFDKAKAIPQRRRDDRQAKEPHLKERKDENQ